jgi:hypothetical protein
VDNISTFRLFLQNPNGLCLTTKPHSLQNDLIQCRNYGASVLCLPETNIYWDIPHQHAILHNILRQTWQATVYCASKSPEEFLSDTQPGGTTTILCDNWTSRLLEKGEDPIGLGRWYVTLRGKGDRKVLIITAYNASFTTGETTNFRQQQCTLTHLHQLHKQQVTANPRRQFILDLQSRIQCKVESGHDIILALVANATYDPDTPDSPHPLQYVKASGCLSFYSMFNSDHRGYYVDFDAKLLFSDPAYEIAPRSYRKLRLHDPKLVDKYRESLHHQLDAHKILEKLTDLKRHATKSTWTSAHTDQYNTLDNIITTAMLSAENQLSRSHSVKFDWSPKLKKAVQAQRYWHLRLKQCKGITVSPARLDFHRSEAEIESDTTSTLIDVVTSLRAAITTLRTYQKEHKTLHASYLEELAEAIVLHRSPNFSHDSL